MRVVKTSSTQVVIAGAGPVGLTLAIELQRRGVDVALLEAKAKPEYFVKALGITPRTLQMWDQVGFLPEAVAAGLFVRGNASLVNGVPSERFRMSTATAAEFPYGFLVLAQFEAERLLREELVRRGGRIQWSTSLTDFRDHGDRVTVAVRSADGTAGEIESLYLAGCDGAHSPVRHGLGLEYEGDALPMTFMLGDVLVDGPLERGWAYRMLQVEAGELTNTLIAIPIPGDPRRYRLSMAAPPPLWEAGADLSTPPTLELLRQTALPMIPGGTAISQLRWSSFYRISHRIAPRYSSGRVFIAGDAAHIHPPIGGQGMNTGMQDAFNLGWKLALACAGRASADLLDSYSAERRPVGLEVVQRTSHRMDEAIEGRDRTNSDDQLRIDSQLGVGYRDSRWVARDAGGAGPRAGDLAPDAGGLRAEWVGAPLRLLELQRQAGFVLLVYADETATADDHRALIECADRVPRDLVSVYGVASAKAAPPNAERILWLADADGAFRRAYGAAGAVVWLLRPDGYVAYRGGADAAELAAHLRTVLS